MNQGRVQNYVAQNDPESTGSSPVRLVTVVTGWCLATVEETGPKATRLLGDGILKWICTLESGGHDMDKTRSESTEAYQIGGNGEGGGGGQR